LAIQKRYVNNWCSNDDLSNGQETNANGFWGVYALNRITAYNDPLKTEAISANSSATTFGLPNILFLSCLSVSMSDRERQQE
jgi:hypothetical protein